MSSTNEWPSSARMRPQIHSIYRSVWRKAPTVSQPSLSSKKAALLAAFRCRVASRLFFHLPALRRCAPIRACSRWLLLHRLSATSRPFACMSCRITRCNERTLRPCVSALPPKCALRARHKPPYYRQNSERCWNWHWNWLRSKKGNDASGEGVEGVSGAGQSRTLTKLERYRPSASGRTQSSAASFLPFSPLAQPGGRSPQERLPPSIRWTGAPATRIARTGSPLEALLRVSGETESDSVSPPQ